MLKKSLIFLTVFISYTIVLGHSIIPHHHHDEIETDHHHDDHDDDYDHSMFSFGTIEHNFVPLSHPISINPDITIQLSAICKPSSLSKIFLPERNIVYKTYEEFPPPENYNHSCGLRAPPIC